MKTNKIGSYAFIAMAIVGVLLIAGCPTSGDDGGGGAVEFSGVLYEDGFTSSVTEPLYWNGKNGFTVKADTTEKKTGTTSFKVDWSAATDWNAVAVNVGSGQAAAGTVDLSGFDALTFWAKASAANAEIDKFGFGADDDKINSIGTRYEVWLENQAVDTTWTKYIIPLPNPAKLTAQNSLFYAADGKNGATIYLDDIKFETLGTVAVSSLTYSGGDMSMNVEGTKTIAGVSAEFTVDGTVIPNVMTTSLVAYVDWDSSAPAVATVDAKGVITGVSAGTATITGTLGTQTDTIAVTVTEAAAVTDTVDSRYYFFGDATGVDTPEIDSSGMTYFASYEETLTFSEETSGGADGTTNYNKFVGTGVKTWAAGGWGEGPYIDFTGYDTLVFWAKAPTTPTQEKIAATQLKIFFQSKHKTADGNIGAPIATVPETTFTTSWVKYEIPFSTFTAEPNFQMNAVNIIKYELLGNDHELHIDEMHLKSSGNAPIFAVRGDDFTKEIEDSRPADTKIANIKKLTFVTSQATSLSYSIQSQYETGAVKIDSATGVLAIADATKFVNATATKKTLTATILITASDGTTDVTDTLTVTIEVKPSSPAPADAPPVPTASNVINLFSDTYDSDGTATQIAGVNWNPNWSQTTVYSEETIAGNTVKKYANLNYQGIEFTSVDVSGKTKVHFDLWTADETSFQFFLISPGQDQTAHTVTPTLNQWNSYDVELTVFSGGNVELDKLYQIKLVGSGNTDGTTKKTVYIDNIYFY